MNGNPPLPELKALHLPPPVSWWPPAPGWWLITILALAGLGAAGYFLFHHYRRGCYRRAALRELRILQAQATARDNPRQLEQLAALLRRVAIEGCGRARVAKLSGEAWLEFLDQSGGTSNFCQGVGRVLGEDLYRAAPTADPAPVYPVVEAWIRRHRSC